MQNFNHGAERYQPHHRDDHLRDRYRPRESYDDVAYDRAARYDAPQERSRRRNRSPPPRHSVSPSPPRHYVSRSPTRSRRRSRSPMVSNRERRQQQRGGGGLRRSVTPPPPRRDRASGGAGDDSRVCFRKYTLFYFLANKKSGLLY